jgi:[ribosomal protein S5]-alanine N-acetyltransferase
VSHTLTTEHLVLQPVTAADQAALLAHWTTPQVRRFMFDGAVLTAADVSEAIESSTGTFQNFGYGLWLVRLRERGGLPLSEAGPLAGTAGLRPLEDLGLEIIWSLAPEAQGRGYATEAARAVLDYALGPLGLPEVLAEIDEGNAASARVAERLGLTAFAVVPGLLGPMTRYRKTR